MCGRFVLATSVPEIASLFNATFEPRIAESVIPSWNVPPTETIPAIVDDKDGERRLRLYRWGLVPPWAKGLSFGANTINARAESIATKASFRTPFRSQRCIIPADGYYEWKTTPGEVRQPYYFTRSNLEPLAFAGLWEAWRSPQIGAEDAGVIYTCAIVTTDANEDVEAIHTRMPVILENDGTLERWLDSDLHDGNELQAMLTPARSGTLARRRVGTAVGSVRNNRPDLVAEELVNPGLF
ncbi:MAG TPA: SOS response-associated peptidase [Acidimicrobiales bacterium]